MSDQVVRDHVAGDRTTPSVWVDESHAIVRKGMLACLRQEGFAVLGESAHLRPEPQLGAADVLVFEAQPGTLRRVRALAGDRTRFVATLRTVDERCVRELVEGGVAAVLPQDDLTPESLGASLRAVVAGRVTLPSDLLPRLLALAARAAQGGSGALSARERDVLRLLADGCDTRQIATDLCYSERTVKNVVHDVLMKMHCRTRAHAVALATREGVI
ncbi:response regulator transcription factor [Thalassiella azotivora]